MRSTPARRCIKRVRSWPTAASRRWTRGSRKRCSDIVLVNEQSLADDLGPAINDLTEGAPIKIHRTNEIIERNPDARIIFTDNIRCLVGDESGMLQGRSLQDASAKDRDHQLDLDYMTADEEISGACPTTMT